MRAPAPLDDDERALLATAAPWAARLDRARHQRLLDLVARFRSGKAVTPVHGLSLDAGQRLQLAALCCLPLLEYGAEGLRGWSEVIVYPGAFRAQRHAHDEDTGVLHEYDEDLIGESWEHGPLVLSWDDIQGEADAPAEGFNVVVHEMAHKLDALDHAMDGTPPLPAAWQRQWARDFGEAYARLCDHLEAGGESVIDPYAAEAPEEFFAVTSEYHFSAPAVLAAEMPAVAEHLRRFYGETPLPGA